MSETTKPEWNKGCDAMLRKWFYQSIAWLYLNDIESLFGGITDLTAENEKLKAEIKEFEGYSGIAYDFEKCKQQLTESQAQVEKLRSDWPMNRRIGGTWAGKERRKSVVQP